jgi:beta-N-acetylhexosaminidase
MNMQAMKRNYRPNDSAIRALLAGVDMIMLAEEHYDHDAATYLKQQTALIGAVKAAIETGAIPMTRVDQAVTRILKLKEQRGLLDSVREKSQVDVLQVGSAEHRAVELEVSREAVAILRNKRGLVPVPRSASVTLVNTTKRDSYAILASTRGIGPNQTEAAFDYFVDAIRDMFASIHVVAAEDVLNDTAEFGEGPIIAVTENYPLPGIDFDQASQVQILQRLSAQYQDRLIVAALRDPYELRLLPRVDTYVCGFSFRPSAAQALAEVLSGQQPVLGKSPVSVPDTEVAANEVVQH